MDPKPPEPPKIDDELDLLHDPEPEPVDRMLDEEEVPGGGNFA